PPLIVTVKPASVVSSGSASVADGATATAEPFSVKAALDRPETLAALSVAMRLMCEVPTLLVSAPSPDAFASVMVQDTVRSGEMRVGSLDVLLNRIERKAVR